ncbi:thiamine phosphate synthase [Leptospira ilyithenensis]|uniref:Thiamine-phosphate synthase n=1 Tax=Leptospira ilyithenensis TaxID=2484901 RepID=A0A4R9LL32_9LEPT|nr:thiamine phosphate synthase [Leptospira ilyithenensis]TGN06945.1 thiamine phosphate synthase [Leptospira ilyithenensis]
MKSESISKKHKFPDIHGPYLVTDRGLCLFHTLESIVAKSIQGGVKLIQLREKDSDTKDFVDLALKIKTILKDTDIPLLINDRIDVALAVGAEGVHIGQSDMPPIYARRILGDSAIIGLSIESMEDFENIPAEAKIDYLGVSPVFATTTKQDTKPPWGIEGLKLLRSKTDLPLVAIGGIGEKNAKQVIDAGADSLAVVSFLCSAEFPEKRAKFLSDLFL